ncbi:glycosyltransferase (plasmid) [Cetobacterium somerae]|uniref:glycosyltransferase n=1 Tax=Cetobacterium somerae TaxID=188913 RepID=UPI003D7698EB
MKLLSIIVPIYNVEKYLDECLKSIYRLNIKKEVILVNDESPDDSYLIIDKYKRLYPDETIVINQKNKGISGARNSGIDIAQGKYISFIDSDDFIDAEKYQNFFNSIKNRDLDILLGNYKIYKEGEKIKLCQRDEKIKNLGIITGKDFFEKSIVVNSFKDEVWDNIYSREFLIKNNLRFKENLLHEDTLFFIQALGKARKVEFLDIPFYFYRQRCGGIMSKLTLKNYQHWIFIITNLIELQKTIKFKGLDKFLLNMLWIIYRRENMVNIVILKKLIFKDIYTLKDYVKICIMYFSKFTSKTIESINLEENYEY